MNVMEYKGNTQPLVSTLSMVARGTRVTIGCDGSDTTLFGTMNASSDVLRMLERCHATYGHTLKVHEVSIVPDYEGSRLLMSCL